MYCIHRIISCFCSQPPPREEELSEQDKKLRKVVRDSSDNFYAFIDNDPNFSNVTDAGLRAASLEAQDLGFPARSIYFSIVLESRHDKDDELLEAARKTDGSFEQFFSNNPDCLGITNQGLKSAISITQKEQLKDRASYLENVLSLRKTFIGKRSDLRVTPSELNQIKSICLREETIPLEEVFVHLRPVKNDKDRYYRAAFFGLLEQIFTSSNRIKNLDVLLTRCAESHLIGEDIKGSFINGLQNISQRYTPQNNREFKRLFSSSLFDEHMVSVARCLLAEHIIQHKGENFHGRMLTEEIASEILRGEEIPPLFLRFGLFGNALGIGLTVTHLDPINGELIHTDSNHFNHPHTFKVHILDSPETYGILYTSRPLKTYSEPQKLGLA